MEIPQGQAEAANFWYNIFNLHLKRKEDAMKKRIVYAAAAGLVLAGCSMLPSVGPDYERPEIELPEYAMPDAGYPTTNRTATGEYEPAGEDDDWRVAITTNEVRN